jgi:hypothetical protein
MPKTYLDKTGLQEVATNVNTRLKTVTVMPEKAKEDAIRLYVGENTSTFLKGHTYQMTKTEKQLLQFNSDVYTYFMTEDGEVTQTPPASFVTIVEEVPYTDSTTGAELVYMAGNNALVQRIGTACSTVKFDFRKIVSGVNPWWTVDAPTGSYNPFAIRNVQLVSVMKWVDITPVASTPIPNEDVEALFE